MHLIYTNAIIILRLRRVASLAPHLLARVSWFPSRANMPELKPIEPKTPRWEPTPDAHNIVVPGLDTTAPVYDQIEQMEQLITIKLQVPYLCVCGITSF